MGQRLNIEVVYERKVVANCYYHWSAYTACAAQLTDKCVDFCLENKMSSPSIVVPAFDPRIYAVNMLEATGARLQYEEFAILEKNEDDPRNKAFLAAFDNPMHREDNDRNRGLISVTEKNMKTTREWEEGRVTIDLDEKRVYFNVFGCECHSLDEFMEFLEDAEIPADTVVMNYDELGLRMPDPIDGTPFEKWHLCVNAINYVNRYSEYGFYYYNGWYYQTLE